MLIPGSGPCLAAEHKDGTLWNSVNEVRTPCHTAYRSVMIAATEVIRTWTAVKTHFFGYASGVNNTAGSENSFFGASSGITNTTGSSNSYFGFESGRQSRIGNENSFFGSRAGGNNDSGSTNTFIGSFAGRLTSTDRI